MTIKKSKKTLIFSPFINQGYSKMDYSVANSEEVNIKLIKRIVYGRSKIVNLTKKCKLAFLIKTDDFNLMDLI